MLNNTFNEICQITLDGYIKNEFDLNILVEIGYDFLGMLFRILKNCPTILFNSPLLKNIINSALVYFNTNQIQDVKNIITFFQLILSYEKLPKFKDLQKKDNILYEKYKNIVQSQINNFGILL